MKKTTYALPTNEELRELFTAQMNEHTEGEGTCQLCDLRKKFSDDKAVQVLLMMCIELADEGPSPFLTAFAHFFRAGMLWQEKQSAIIKDADELARIFNICDDRNEKREKS